MCAGRGCGEESSPDHPSLSIQAIRDFALLLFMLCAFDRGRDAVVLGRYHAALMIDYTLLFVTPCDDVSLSPTYSFTILSARARNRLIKHV